MSSTNLTGNLEEKYTLQCQDYRFVAKMYYLLAYVLVAD